MTNKKSYELLIQLRHDNKMTDESTVVIRTITDDSFEKVAADAPVVLEEVLNHIHPKEKP
jgi:hypothetical protein